MADKTKRAMSRDLKDKARARKEPRTKARKAARRVAQDQAASRNRVLRAGGEATPWELSETRRKARNRGVSGAA